MSAFSSLSHFTPWTKAFVMVTSQLDGQKLVCEYFLLIFDDQGKPTKKSQVILYPQQALNLLSVEGKHIEYGLSETISQVTNELTAFLIERFCRQTSPGVLDPRCKIAMGLPVLNPASISFLARNLPDDNDYLLYFQQTRNKELQQFLQNVFRVKKLVEFHPLKR